MAETGLFCNSCTLTTAYCLLPTEMHDFIFYLTGTAIAGLIALLILRRVQTPKP